ncbi:DUF2304 domain-containing protein [Lachnospiraceae bacterium ZAX-1]
MSFRTQIIIAVAILIVLIIICNFIRKNILDLKYALVWFMVGIIILILDLFPGIMEKMAAYLGIQLPINMLFFLGFCFSLLIIFVLTIVISGLSRRVKKLTQEIALLDKKIEELQKKG